MPNWSQLCANQLHRPLWQKQQANEWSCLFAVRNHAAYHLAPCSHCIQLVSFAVAALYSGVWFWRWLRAGVRNRMWPRLGWFCGLVCAGSVAGAAAWGAQMQFYTFQYLSQATGPDAHTLITHQQHYILYAASLRWNVAFLFL